MIWELSVVIQWILLPLKVSDINLNKRNQQKLNYNFELFFTSNFNAIFGQNDLFYGLFMDCKPIFLFYFKKVSKGDQNSKISHIWKAYLTFDWLIYWEPPTMSKQLINFITCGCESSAPFFVIYKTGCEPTPYWW